MQKLILASGSPRRKQLLSAARVAFNIRVAATGESYPTELTGREIPQYIAKGKADALWAQLSEPERKSNTIIAADTVVVLGEKIIGKPKNEKAAISCLMELSGKCHQVITGVCLMTNKGHHVFFEETKVWFRELFPEQIRFYVRTFRPFDKAGAYAIQEWIGLIGIEKIEGDYYNVMGLPVSKLLAELKAFCPDSLKFQS